jgi:uncharacterized protein (TIGR01777 family)
MRVAVTGATGLIGSEVARLLRARGDDVIALSRDRDRARRQLGADVEVHEWRRPEAESPPAAALERADAVINLLGEPIAQRWTVAAQRKIRDSRVLSTRSLVAALADLPEASGPKTLVSQSAVGYYGPRGDEQIDENVAGGDDFLASVTADWEREAGAASPRARVVLTRTGVVLARSEGALAKMLPPFRLGLGGPVAGGRQYVPWIHLEDVARALIYCARDERAAGPINVTAPTPVTNRELSQALGRVLHRPAVLPVPALALRLLYDEMASIVVTGQRVVPARLKALGFEFNYAELEPALRDVLARS